MVGCVLSQLKPSEHYILSCGKGLGLRPRPFPQLRMWYSSGFILYVKSSKLVYMYTYNYIYTYITNNAHHSVIFTVTVDANYYNHIINGIIHVYYK